MTAYPRVRVWACKGAAGGAAAAKRLCLAAQPLQRGDAPSDRSRRTTDDEIERLSDQHLLPRIVDPAALRRGAENGWIAGAGSTSSTANRDRRSVIAIAECGRHPHIGNRTTEGVIDVVECSIRNVLAVVEGRAPEYVVRSRDLGRASDHEHDGDEDYRYHVLSDAGAGRTLVAVVVDTESGDFRCRRGGIAAASDWPSWGRSRV